MRDHTRIALSVKKTLTRISDDGDAVVVEQHNYGWGRVSLVACRERLAACRKVQVDFFNNGRIALQEAVKSIGPSLSVVYQ